MSKDKWKTQPCKTCLLKGRCKGSCFPLPDSTEVADYIRRNNNIENTCLSCGSIWLGRNYFSIYGMSGCTWSCNKCSIRNWWREYDR